ncbi:MAG: tetratricopeptide repeat protein, partial [Synergistaceae bacterium]|nr:tetratricopeptide repeat protein [Synergistaceae bacterium]
MKATSVWACTLVCVFCCVFAFAAEVRANGNTSADDPVPQIKKSVRKAPIKPIKPIKKPAKKNRKNTRKKLAVVEEAIIAPTSLEIGISLVTEGRYEQARSWLQKSVQEERYNPYAWYWYGMVHEKMGQFQQAQFFY